MVDGAWGKMSSKVSVGCTALCRIRKLVPVVF